MLKHQHRSDIYHNTHGIGIFLENLLLFKRLNNENGSFADELHAFPAEFSKEFIM